MRRRFKKRLAVASAFVPERSEKMRQVSDLTTRGDYSESLRQINEALPKEASAAGEAKLLGQVARTLYRRGKYADAAETLSRASELAANESREWFGPMRGCIHALLKDVSVAEAEAEALRCLRTAEEKVAQFQRARAGAVAEFARTGRVVVPVKPHRVPVVASELGDLFLLEGELEIAKSFFDKALENNPRGGTRARQGLAEIALRMDDAETAFQRSVEALTLGKFQAKTVASWTPFFAARRKLGYTGLSPEFVASLQGARPSVRARSWLVVVKELRATNDPQWEALAKDWLATDGAKFPTIAAEMRKLFMASKKLTLKDPTAQAAAARQLLGTPNLAPLEWLSAAKEIVRSTFFAGGTPATAALIASGVKLYGEQFKSRICHSLALSCMMAKRHGEARVLLKEAIGLDARKRTEIWSKALWALGRMEAFLGKHTEAAKAYDQVAGAAAVPERFRLQARMLWAECMLASGNEKALEACAKELPEMLSGVRDYSVLLDFARQLSHSKGSLRSLATKVFSMGEAAALKAFDSATHPSQALDILFRLTRRQVYDFGRYTEALRFWKALPESKKLWLWTNDNRWWSYLAFVLLAYLEIDDLRGAEGLAQATLDDPATPRTALAAILVPYYQRLISKGRPTEALEAFQWIVTENPTRAGCAPAFYWMALDAYRREDNQAVQRLCQSLLLCNANTEITYDKWMFDAKARLLEAGLKPEKVSPQAVDFDASYLNKARDEIIYHLSLLSQPQ